MEEIIPWYMYHQDLYLVKQLLLSRNQYTQYIGPSSHKFYHYGEFLFNEVDIYNTFLELEEHRENYGKANN